MTISLIAARTRNGVIGKDGGMPWHLPEDLKYFKRTTMGHPMIMGRKTFDSMGALPGRRSIVVTRNRDWSADGVEVARDLDHALALVGDDDVFVVGGAQIYHQAMPYADRLYLTEIDREVDGDTFFPEFTDAEWTPTSREPQDGYDFVVYERAAPRSTVVVAPGATDGARLKVGASAAVFVDGRLLVTRREDNHLWCLPGGGVDPGETWESGVIREVYEEVGLQVRVERLLTAYSDPDVAIVGKDGSTRTQIFGACFLASVVAGEAGLSDEVVEVRWVDADDAGRLPFIPMHRPLVPLAFAAATDGPEPPTATSEQS